MSKDISNVERIATEVPLVLNRLSYLPTLTLSGGRHHGIGRRRTVARTVDLPPRYESQLGAPRA